MSKKYKYIKIGLASPEKILSWSHGEVETHETINYRTLKPEPKGLFCEAIFGPSKDYQCYCGKSKRNLDKGKVCEYCGVELTEAKVRRERLGHIKLASPVVHSWYLKSIPSPLAILLDLKNKDLESIVYFASYIVTEPRDSGLLPRTILDENQYREAKRTLSSFEALTGAEAIYKLLANLNLEEVSETLRRKLRISKKQKRDAIIKRLEIVEAFLASDNKPEWMVLQVLPVIPPDIRPMVQLDGGRFATTDLNDLYRRILNRNNRLKKQIEQQAPYLIIKNEKRMLQEAVDSLIDNAKKRKKNPTDRNTNLKSLSDMLRGKQGRFRQNLLGKRVDYSGRSVIVVGPSLKMYQCGIPREMALNLFKPFVIRDLAISKNVSLPYAKKMCERKDDSVWSILESIVQEHPVLLNRAPTLHRLGIQAFEPVLIDGKAIRLHPLVCNAFNADFDGDQMPVHVPLSLEAQAEARVLMLASNNILNPKDGKPVVTPSQDMVLGNYYLTLEKEGLPNEGHVFFDYDEAFKAYKNNQITLHTRIFVSTNYLNEAKYPAEFKGAYLFTTIGKMIFNSILPATFPYLNEPELKNVEGMIDRRFFFKPKDGMKKEDFLAYPLNKPFNKKFLAIVIAEIFKLHKVNVTSSVLDDLKDLGFHYSTRSGISISMSDVLDYKEKEVIIKKADEQVAIYKELYEKGYCTDRERKNHVKEEWSKARNDIEKGVWEELTKHKDNAIFMMADSGSRGSSSNFSQLAGMRGLMSNTKGQSIEVPVKANFREGLSVSEFFISTHGARKGSTDTALKTAQSGYLTRRLVDVSQDVIITEKDCGTDRGFKIYPLITEDGKEILPIYDRILGRYLAKAIINPKTEEVLFERNTLLDEDKAHQIDKLYYDLRDENIELPIFIRSSLTCRAKSGVCCKCYGRDLATNNVVSEGEAVGVVAAQSIGEPGTQLTMRTFHTGGVASTADITQGLPRVQELFENRTPKGKATMVQLDGTVERLEKVPSGILITVSNGVKSEDYLLEPTSELLVQKGDDVKRGDRLNKGPLHPKELLRIKGLSDVQRYIIDEIQKVYRSQGVEISDKHIEIVVRQMLRKVHVVYEGDSNLLPSKNVSFHEFLAEDQRCIEEGLTRPFAKPVILGISKASLASDSFLSACSFEETTKVLTNAAIRSKKDYLQGLKENVIIGGLIPAGTGILQDRSFVCEHKPQEEEELE